MSNPFVAGLSDILAIVIYMTVALTLLSSVKPETGLPSSRLPRGCNRTFC